MLSVNDTIHGWSPTGGEDEDVNVTPDMRFLGIRPLSLSHTILSPVCPPLDSTPRACVRPPATGIASSSDRRTQRNRHRDPSWIPRPRNAFIIFRCEYSREHAQGSQDAASDDESANPTVKTLSKRAADAWKQMPASERERYKVLADKEREEHARLYPHYRFRPMKRQASAVRRPSRECAKGARMPSVERPPAPSRQLPSVLAPAPEKAPPDERAMPLPEVDYNDALLSCPMPETALRTDPVALYAPEASGSGVHPDVFGCDDGTQEYAIGLYNYDLFSPFSFPEYY